MKKSKKKPEYLPLGWIVESVDGLDFRPRSFSSLIKSKEEAQALANYLSIRTKGLSCRIFEVFTK
jgi:hypothetical protein